MPKPISAWRTARSFIGNTGAEETVELDFNIGTREAIEISGVLGMMAPTAAVASASNVPVVSAQSLHIEDGTVEVLSDTGAAADQFERDSEVIFEQILSVTSFDGTTEGGSAISQTPSGLVVYANPVLSPINLTHRVDNEASSLDVGARLLIFYRYVELSDTELALEFARRRR